MTRAQRLQIVRRSGEAATAPATERRDTPGAKAVAEEVLEEEEVPTTNGVPKGQAVARVEEPAAALGET